MKMRNRQLKIPKVKVVLIVPKYQMLVHKNMSKNNRGIIN